jgi:LysM repeat protein
MKVSKIFGCVLGLHFGVIAVLLIQPGCRTKQPPTQTYTQDRTTDGFIPATGVAPGDGLDAAFNAGFEDGRPAVDSAANEFSEFDNVAPLTPLTSGGQSVQVAGPSFEAYIVKKGDNLWSIAKRYNVSLNELYTANGLNKNSVLRIGQQIQVPVEGGTASISTVSADTYQPTSFNQGSTSYTVKRGDTLSKIANQYDTSVRAIKAANSMTSDLIRVGETLVIPVGANANTSGALGTSGTSLGTSAASAAPSSTVTTSGSRTHTVKPGEYPATIARQYGMPTGELLALNGITDPRKLQVGQVLKINGSGSAANVDSRTETVVTPAPAPVSPAPRVPVTSSGPVEIRVIEADPLVEGEATEIQTDEVFDGAVEIPVIRLEESASSASSSPL